MSQASELIAQQLAANASNPWTVAENFNNLISSLAKRLQNGEVTKIKLIGDSITQGAGSIGYVYPAPSTQPVIFFNGTEIYYEGDYACRAWANLFREWIATNFPSVSFVNAGISGKSATFALANQQYWVEDSEDVVIVMLGTNDRGGDINTYKSNMEQFLKYVKSKSNLMIVMTPPPASDEYDSYGEKIKSFTTPDMDRVLTEICTENGYSHISLLREVLDYCRVSGFGVNHVNSKYSDSHPNDFGHDLVWYVIQQSVGISDNKRWMVSNQTRFDQMFIDGNFQIAQAVPTVGTEVTNPSYNTYPVFDAWGLGGFIYSGESLPSTIKHSQRKITDSGAEIDAVPGSKYCYRVSVNGAGTIVNTEYSIVQAVENGPSRYLAGTRLLFVSFWARSSIVGKKIQISAYFNYGTGGSPSTTDYTSDDPITLTNDWEKYSTIIVLPTLDGKTIGTNQDDHLGLRISLCGKFQSFLGAGDIEISQAQISTFSSAPFQVKTFEEELKACLPYYEKSYSYEFNNSLSNSNGVDGGIVPSNSIINLQVYGSFRFSVPKIKKPIVTVYPLQTPANSNQVTNGTRTADLGANSGVPIDIGESGFLVRNESGSTLTTTNNFVQFHWVANARRSAFS